MQTLLMSNYLKLEVADWLKKSIGISEPRLVVESTLVPLVDWLARLESAQSIKDLPAMLHWASPEDPAITLKTQLYWSVQPHRTGTQVTAVNKGGDIVFDLDLIG